MHNVRECKEARSCGSSKISTTCLVRCRKERTVRCGGEWKHVAHGYPRTGCPDQPPKEKRPVARKKRRELGEEAFHGSASCLLVPTPSGRRRSTARAFSRCSLMPSAWNSRSASDSAPDTEGSGRPASRSLHHHGQEPFTEVLVLSEAGPRVHRLRPSPHPQRSEVGCAFVLVIRVCDGEAVLEAHYCAEEKLQRVDPWPCWAVRAAASVRGARAELLGPHQSGLVQCLRQRLLPHMRGHPGQ